MRRLLPIHSNSKLMPVDLTSYVTTFLVKRNNVKQCFETWSFNLQPWHICISFVHFQWMYLWQNWFATYPFTPGSTYYLPLFLEHPHSHLLTLLCCGQPVLNNTLWDRLTDLDMLLKYSGHSQINVNNSIGVTLNSSLPKKISISKRHCFLSSVLYIPIFRRKAAFSEFRWVVLYASLAPLKQCNIDALNNELNQLLRN